MTGLRIWLLVALVIAGGAFMACKSSKKSTSTKPTATQSSSATETGTTPSSSGGDASSQLADLESKLSTKEVKASYNYSSTAAGTTSSGSFTLYSKPPDWRVDFTVAGTTTTLISAGGSSYICTPADGGGTCTNSPTSLGSAFPFISFFTNPSSLSGFTGTSVDHSTKTVAGQSADCYKGSGGGASGELCFNGDGVLVSLTGGSAGTEFSMEATSVEGSLAASDLTPPYPVQ